LYGLLAHIIRIAMLFRFGSVLAAALHAAEPLRTRLGFSGFVLALCLVTPRTGLHPLILAHIFSHSQGLKSGNFLQFCMG
jgi:hypothetical protein